MLPIVSELYAKIQKKVLGGDLVRNWMQLGLTKFWNTTILFKSLTFKSMYTPAVISQFMRAICKRYSQNMLTADIDVFKAFIFLE